MARPDGAAHQKPVIGSCAKTFPPMTPHNLRASGRRFHPGGYGARPERKNKSERISADVRSDLELHRPIADDRESNHAFRCRSEDRQEKLDRFANAPACAR